MYKFGAANPVVNGLGNPVLFRDTDRKTSYDQTDKMLDSNLLLLVFICILAEETEADAHLGLGERAAVLRDKATPIGSLALAPHREGQSHIHLTRVGLAIGEEHQNKVGTHPAARNTWDGWC